jgi:hypothetical protein
MRCITIAAVAASGFGALACVAPAQAELVVNISKSQQQLAVSLDGTELYRWPVSTGRPGLETPSGSYHPIRLERKWYSRRYDWTPMPWSMFFYRGYAVHGTLEARKLGRAVSHGCVRLQRANAETLFSLVREQGKSSTMFVVSDDPLPQQRKPRQDEPVADVPAPPAKLIVKPVAGIAKPEPKAATKIAREAEPNVELKPLAVSAPVGELKPEPAKFESAPEAKPAVAVKAAIEPPPAVAEQMSASKQSEPPATVPVSEAALMPEVAPQPVPLPPARVASVPREQETQHDVAPPPPASKQEKAHRAVVNHVAPRRVHTQISNASYSSGNEAAVLRDRAAWLRSLDRKYGIAR